MLFFVKGNKTHSLFLIRHCGLAVLLAHLLITFKLGGGVERTKGKSSGSSPEETGSTPVSTRPLWNGLGSLGLNERGGGR